jgi:hypothetical protein
MTESTNSSALAVRRAAPISGYNPPPNEDEFRAMIYMAKQLSEVQGFVPAHFYKQPNKILAAMLYGRDLGITPTNALQHIIVIEGKATADAQLMGMLVRRAGHRLEDKTTEQASTVTITRGDDGTTHTFTFTMQDAARAGLVRVGSAWQKFPQAMLFARALTGCARKGAQDALMGVAYTPEELGVEVGSDGFTGEIPIDQATPESVAAVSGVSEAVGSLPAAAIQPTPPAPSARATMAAGVPAAEVPQEPAAPAAEVSQAPPQTAPFNATPLAGPSVNRRMGRSIGPQPKRTNTVEVPHPATGPVEASRMPATAPEVAPDAVPQPEPVPSQPAPSDLIEEPAPVDEGKRVYLDQQRELLRVGAAELAHVNALLKNHAHALKSEEAEPVPPTVPSAVSDEGLARLIDRDYPGRQLANLGEPELQNRLELVEGNLAKKREMLAERGITED